MSLNPPWLFFTASRPLFSRSSPFLLFSHSALINSALDRRCLTNMHFSRVLGAAVLLSTTVLAVPPKHIKRTESHHNEMAVGDVAAVAADGSSTSTMEDAGTSSPAVSSSTTSSSEAMTMRSTSSSTEMTTSWSNISTITASSCSASLVTSIIAITENITSTVTAIPAPTMSSNTMSTDDIITITSTLNTASSTDLSTASLDPTHTKHHPTP
ncbi:hypothetical protein BJ875DRAFT_199882 [Amylocarpus encephaloides]|uniref:Uncharacterized protein n=1 Tax=Amylocarpus encephaloides TaxID=45428 RepID=A0A9P8C807_9HELO|nr:hypothetical protein BJ875DRAFT_199882 [Amylocarpus encephaloides]